MRDISRFLKIVLSVTSHINCIAARCLINVVYLTACVYQVMMTLHFFNDVANDASEHKNYNIFVSVNQWVN